MTFAPSTTSQSLSRAAGENDVATSDARILGEKEPLRGSENSLVTVRGNLGEDEPLRGDSGHSVIETLLRRFGDKPPRPDDEPPRGHSGN